MNPCFERNFEGRPLWFVSNQNISARCFVLLPDRKCAVSPVVCFPAFFLASSQRTRGKTKKARRSDSNPLDRDVCEPVWKVRWPLSGWAFAFWSAVCCVNEIGTNRTRHETVTYENAPFCGEPSVPSRLRRQSLVSCPPYVLRSNPFYAALFICDIPTKAAAQSSNGLSPNAREYAAFLFCASARR